jgi:hypothetical protein
MRPLSGVKRTEVDRRQQSQWIRLRHRPDGVDAGGDVRPGITDPPPQPTALKRKAKAKAKGKGKPVQP